METLFPSLNKSKNFFCGCTAGTTPDPPAVFGTNHTSFLMPPLAEILPNMW